MSKRAEVPSDVVFMFAVALMAGCVAAAASQTPPNFAAPVKYNVGAAADTFIPNAAPRNVVTGDFNGDGKLDLVVSHTSDNSIYFFAGNGDGTFKAPVITSVGVAIDGTMCVGDFNGDGKLDIFVAEHSYVPGTTTVGPNNPVILLGNGDGTFKVTIDKSSTFNVPGCYPRGWAVADFNGDGKLDIVAGCPVATNGANTFIVLQGNGDGTFKKGFVAPAGWLNYVRWVAVGDFNGDGKLDLAFGDGNGPATPETAELTIVLGNGDGTFSLGGHFPSPGVAGVAAGNGENPEGVNVADLNGDGKLDVIVSDYELNINVFIGKGDGTFKPAVSYATGARPLYEYPRAVAVADVNGDGIVDLIVNNLGVGPGGIDFAADGKQPGSVAVLLGNGDGTFQPPIQYTPFFYPGWVVAADFNGDGRPDLAVTGVADDHAVAVILNQPPLPPQAPAITTQPANQTVTVGQTATFRVVATGTPAPTYQWTKNGGNIAGATSASYTTLATAQGDNGAVFAVVVSNSAGTVTSANATLTVNAVPVAPAITTQPANQMVTVGQTAMFSVVATGFPAPTYQWTKNGGNIAGATSASYTTPATTLADSGAVFAVVVSNSAGKVTSANATLTVTVSPVVPSITTQPASVTVTAGQTATFSVAATGTSPLAYQWQKNGMNISGATSASYTTPATNLVLDNGSTYVVVVSNSAGSITSNVATLTVTATPVAPAITTQPSNLTVIAGQTATFSVAATGTGPLSYQWQRNRLDIAGATGSSYTTAPTSVFNDSGAVFSVVVSNSIGSVTSNFAILTVISQGTTTPLPPTPPTIGSPLTPPGNVVINVPTTFSITATDPNGGALSYVWNFGDGATDTSGGTVTHTYSTPGDYTVSVTITTTSGGAVTSSMTINVGAGALSPFLLTVSKMQGSVNFKRSGHDVCSVMGVIPNVAAGFNPKGVELDFNIAGAADVFILDTRGHAKNTHGTLALKYKLTRNKATHKSAFAGGNVTFMAKLSGAWSAAWAGAGIAPNATEKSMPVSVVVNLIFNGATYSGTATALYSSKAGVGGKFKKATK